MLGQAHTIPVNDDLFGLAKSVDDQGAQHIVSVQCRNEASIVVVPVQRDEISFVGAADQVPELVVAVPDGTLGGRWSLAQNIGFSGRAGLRQQTVVPVVGAGAYRVERVLDLYQVAHAVVGVCDSSKQRVGDGLDAIVLVIGGAGSATDVARGLGDDVASLVVPQGLNKAPYRFAHQAVGVVVGEQRDAVRVVATRGEQVRVFDGRTQLVVGRVVGVGLGDPVDVAERCQATRGIPRPCETTIHEVLGEGEVLRVGTGAVDLFDQHPAGVVGVARLAAVCSGLADALVVCVESLRLYAVACICSVGWQREWSGFARRSGDSLVVGPGLCDVAGGVALETRERALGAQLPLQAVVLVIPESRDATLGVRDLRHVASRVVGVGGDEVHGVGFLYQPAHTVVCVADRARIGCAESACLGQHVAERIVGAMCNHVLCVGFGRDAVSAVVAEADDRPHA